MLSLQQLQNAQANLERMKSEVTSPAARAILDNWQSTLADYETEYGIKTDTETTEPPKNAPRRE